MCLFCRADPDELAQLEGGVSVFQRACLGLVHLPVLPNVTELKIEGLASLRTIAVQPRLEWLLLMRCTHGLAQAILTWMHLVCTEHGGLIEGFKDIRPIAKEFLNEHSVVARG
jgi:hypothetical protein